MLSYSQLSNCNLVSIVCLADVCLVPVLTRCHFCCEFISHQRHFNCLLLEFLRSTSLNISYHHHRCNKKCALNSTWTIFSQPFPNLRIERERWGKNAVVIWTNAVNGSNHSSVIRTDFFIFLSQWKRHSVITRTADAQIGTYAVILPNLDSSLPETCNFFLLLLWC